MWCMSTHRCTTPYTLNGSASVTSSYKRTRTSGLGFWSMRSLNVLLVNTVEYLWTEWFNVIGTPQKC